jgi:hypothetical protein
MAQRKTPSYTALLAFARMAGRLSKDGECRRCGRGEFEDNPECSNHHPIELESDDAVESLHILIGGARDLLAHGYLRRGRS